MATSVKKPAAKTAAAKKTPATKTPATRPAPAAKAAPAKAVKSAKASAPAADAPRLIDERIADLGGWRGEMLARVRALILAADPQVVEEWKWGVPIWSRDGILCTGEGYKTAIKLTFMKGASVPDPTRIFNSSLDGNARRAVDLHEGDAIDEKAFTALIRAAIAANAK